MVYKDSSEKIKKICLKTFDELKANDIKELNIEKISSFATYLLIATGTSNRHIKSIAGKVKLIFLAKKVLNHRNGY